MAHAGPLGDAIDQRADAVAAAVARRPSFRERRGRSAAPVAPAADEEGIESGETEINVRNAEIASVIRIFSKKTKRNYILDEKVRGKVSIFLPGRVSEERDGHLRWPREGD